MSAKIVVVRKVKVDMVNAVGEMADLITKEAVKLGIRRAKLYSPVRTGNLKQSIKMIGRNGWGSRVYYAGFVEDGTRHMFGAYYMKRSLLDVNRALPGITHDAFIRSTSHG